VLPHSDTEADQLIRNARKLVPRAPRLYGFWFTSRQKFE
jgi:hypothetical protein